MVCILSTQSRKVCHKHPRRFLALPLMAHHLFLPTTQVMDRVFILLKQMPTDSLHITLFIHHLQRFGPRPSFVAPVPWMQPSPYFSPLGAAPYGPPMPPPGPPTYAQADPSHSGT